MQYHFSQAKKLVLVNLFEQILIFTYNDIYAIHSKMLLWLHLCNEGCPDLIHYYVRSIIWWVNIETSSLGEI